MEHKENEVEGEQTGERSTPNASRSKIVTLKLPRNRATDNLRNIPRSKVVILKLPRNRPRDDPEGTSNEPATSSSIARDRDDVGQIDTQTKGRLPDPSDFTKTEELPFDEIPPENIWPSPGSRSHEELAQTRVEIAGSVPNIPGALWLESPRFSSRLSNLMAESDQRSTPGSGYAANLDTVDAAAETPEQASEDEVIPGAVHDDDKTPGTTGDDDETSEEFRNRLIYWFQQMMFVSGETTEPSTETTGMIEEIVRAQVIEMVSLRFIFYVGFGGRG